MESEPLSSVDLDGVATAPPLPQIVEAMRPWLSERSANPASPHRRGREAARVLEAARAETAALVGGSPDRVVFTSGATESNNAALRGAGNLALALGRPGIAVAAHEHPSLLHPARSMARTGWTLNPIPVDRSGLIAPGSLPDAPLGVLALTHAHAELGALQPVAGLVTAARERGALSVIDATLTAGRIPLDCATLGEPDILTLSFHHFGGPMGVGALVLREDLPLPPLLEGGTQEKGFRPGTPNLAGCVGAGITCRDARRQRERRLERLSRLGERLSRGLHETEGVHRTGPPPEQRLPGHVSVRAEGVNGEALLTALEDRGILGATASPCADEANLPSAALMAAGYSREEAGEAVLFCIPPTWRGGEEEIDRVRRGFAEEVRRLRELGT